MNAIELHNINFAYQEGTKKETVFSGFDLKLAQGGFFFMVGANGSGKSTLIKLILGAEQPDSGDIIFSTINRPSRKERTRLIGYVPQDVNLDHEMSVRDILNLIAALHGLKSSRKEQMISRVKAALELDHFFEKRIKMLSGGQKQRVNIALGLLHDPEILLLDEPFTGLDYYTSTKMLTMLKSLDKTIVCITHDLDLAAQYADEIIVLKSGKLMEKGKPIDLVVKHPFGLIELDFNAPSDQLIAEFDFPDGFQLNPQQNRLIISFPKTQENEQVLDQFVKKYNSNVLNETRASRTLKSTIVGLHNIHSVVGAKVEPPGKRKGGGDGTGGGGGKGKGRNRK